MPPVKSPAWRGLTRRAYAVQTDTRLEIRASSVATRPGDTLCTACRQSDGSRSPSRMKLDCVFAVSRSPTSLCGDAHTTGTWLASPHALLSVIRTLKPAQERSCMFCIKIKLYRRDADSDEAMTKQCCSSCRSVTKAANEPNGADGQTISSLVQIIDEMTHADQYLRSHQNSHRSP